MNHSDGQPTCGRCGHHRYHHRPDCDHRRAPGGLVCGCPRWKDRPPDPARDADTTGRNEPTGPAPSRTPSPEDGFDVGDWMSH